MNATPSKPVLICAMGLLVSFFLPWVEIEGASISGYNITRLGSYANYVWIIPILSGVTIIVSLLNKDNRLFGGITGVIVLGAIFYALAKTTNSAKEIEMAFKVISKVLAIGGWSTIIFSLAILRTSLMKNTGITVTQNESTAVNFSSQQFSETSKEEIKVLKIIIKDPINGIANEYLKLGEEKSLKNRLFLSIITIILFTLGGVLADKSFFNGLFSSLIIFMIVFLSLVISREYFNGKGTINSDIIFASISLFPFSLLFFISGIVNVYNKWSLFAYLTVGLTFTILILYGSLTKIYNFSESKSAMLIAFILFCILNAIGLVF